MVDRLDGYYRCDTCGCTGRIPRSLLVKKVETKDELPVVGTVNVELLYIQHKNNVMFLDYGQAVEVLDRLVELVTQGNAEEEFYEEAPVANDT